MKWIKASENSDPGISKYYIVRNRISKQNANSVYIDKRTTLLDYCDSMRMKLDDTEWLDESPTSTDTAHTEELSECYFTPDKKTSSATICANCGKEKMLHTIGDGLKATSIEINPKPVTEELSTPPVRVKSAEEVLLNHLSDYEVEFLGDKTGNITKAMKAYASQFTPHKEGYSVELELIEYWRERCLAAEVFIKESPCDPDITATQIEAYNKWQDLNKSYPPNSLTN